jgi:hypothetical protein
MFEYFDNSVGVANIDQFMGLITHPPRWVTSRPGGFGFAELADLILA